MRVVEPAPRPLTHYEKIAQRTAKAFRVRPLLRPQPPPGRPAEDGGGDRGGGSAALTTPLVGGLPLDLTGVQPRADLRQPLSDRSTQDRAEQLLRALLPNPQPAPRVQPPPAPAAAPAGPAFWPRGERGRHPEERAPQCVALPAALTPFMRDTHAPLPDPPPESPPRAVPAKQPSTAVRGRVPPLARSPPPTLRRARTEDPHDPDAAPATPPSAAAPPPPPGAGPEGLAAALRPADPHGDGNWLSAADNAFIARVQGGKRYENLKVPVREYLNVKRMFEELDEEQEGRLTWPVLRGRFIGRTRISRSVYFRMDKDRSGGAGFFDILRALYPSVSFRELLRPCKVLGYPFEPDEPQAAKDIPEAWRSKFTAEQQQEIEAIFHQFVKDDPGALKLSRELLRRFVPDFDMDDALFAEMFSAADLDHDGSLSLAEFAETLEDLYVEQHRRQQVSIKLYYDRTPWPKVVF